jgi:hypothetical protein
MMLRFLAPYKTRNDKLEEYCNRRVSMVEHRPLIEIVNVKRGTYRQEGVWLIARNTIDVYMMFRRLILSLGETGALFGPYGIDGSTYGEGSCRDAGLVDALAECGRGSVGSASEWKEGSDRCGTLIGAD